MKRERLTGSIFLPPLLVLQIFSFPQKLFNCKVSNKLSVVFFVQKKKTHSILYPLFHLYVNCECCLTVLVFFLSPLLFLIFTKVPCQHPISLHLFSKRSLVSIALTWATHLCFFPASNSMTTPQHEKRRKGRYSKLFCSTMKESIIV